MAPFTQNINPINAPDYGGKSRPVDLPEGIRPQGVATNQIMPHGVMEGDKSAAYAGESQAASIKAGAVGELAYGELFKNIVGTADFLGKAGVQMVKKDIEDKVYEVADRERQAYTEALERIKNSTGGVRNILDANASADETPETPAEVAGLPDTLSALQGARDSGKISGSYYQSRLLAEAKNLRAQYPGFREEIDQAFAKVTGSNPANAYIHNLVQDINRAAGAQNSEMNRTLSFIQSHLKYPNAEKVFQGVAAGLINRSQAVEWAAPYAQQDYRIDQYTKQMNAEGLARTDRERVSKEGLDYAAGTVVNRAVDQILGQMGIATADDVSKMSSLQASGNIPATQWQVWGQAAANIRSRLFTTMVADADAHGFTKAVGGKEEVIRRINAALEPFDKGVIDRIYHKDFGGIYNTQRDLKAQFDENKKALLNDPKVGPPMQQVEIMKEIGGEQYLQRFYLDQIKGDFSDNYKEYFKRIQGAFQSQYNLKTTGNAYTFNDAIDHLKAQKVTDGKFNKAVLDEVLKITDKNIPEPIRKNIALAAFSDGNRGMISRLQADGYDAQGKAIYGQNAVYQKFTSPQMTETMYEMGKKDPAIWNQYVKWSKETMANELVPTDIARLTQIRNPSIQVGWDPKNHRLQATYSGQPIETRGRPGLMAGGITSDQTGRTDPEYGIVQQSVHRINNVLYNYKNLATATGEDADAFILKSIADAAGPEVLKDVTGIPYRIMRDIGLSRLQMMNNAR